MNPITATASLEIVAAEPPLIKPGKDGIEVLDVTRLVMALTHGDLWTPPPRTNH
jgi:hypothetical protein